MLKTALKCRRSQQSSALKRHRIKAIPLASRGHSNCIRSLLYHQIQTFLVVFLPISTNSSFQPGSPQPRLRCCSAGLFFPAVCLDMQTQRSCQPACMRIFCVVSAALDFHLMKSWPREARWAPVVGALWRRAWHLPLR